MVWPEPPASGRKTAGGILSFLPPILIAERATVYARGSSLGGEGEAATVHSQNALSLAGVRGASEDHRRGSLGFGKRNFFPDEIALCGRTENEDDSDGSNDVVGGAFAGGAFLWH
nr:hypothetical protein TorRG33x02_151700 [Ipomoea batatas]